MNNERIPEIRIPCHYQDFSKSYDFVILRNVEVTHNQCSYVGIVDWDTAIVETTDHERETTTELPLTKGIAIEILAFLKAEQQTYIDLIDSLIADGNYQELVDAQVYSQIVS